MGPVPILNTNKSDLEEFWDDLLAFIADRRVIPVIGPEVLLVVDSGKNISLYQALAERLVRKYGISVSISDEAESCLSENSNSDAVAHLRPRHVLNDAVCALAISLAKKRRSIQDLYRHLNDLLRDLVDSILADPQNEILTPLRQLAAISYFDLFVTTTFDDLLARTIDRERFGGQPNTVQVEFAPNLPDDKRRDIVDPKKREPGYKAVLYLFGKSSPSPTYAIHDEDILEFVYNLQIAHINVPKTFLSEIRSKNLLLIGCNFADWLSRFFLRLSNPGRLSDNLAKKEFLVGSGALVDRSLTLFLEQFSQKTRLYPMGAREFISELFRRWNERMGTPVKLEGFQPNLLSFPKTRASVDIFISYAREDLAAALILSGGLKEIGGDVIWFDKSTLRPGDEWELEIQRAIKLCDLFLPLISENTEKRWEGFFRKEWNWAADRSRGFRGKDSFSLS